MLPYKLNRPMFLEYLGLGVLLNDLNLFFGSLCKMYFSVGQIWLIHLSDMNMNVRKICELDRTSSHTPR